MLSFCKKLSISVFAFMLVVAPSVVLAQTLIPSGMNPWQAGQANASAAGLPDRPIYQIISSTLSWLLAVLGFLAIAGFVISGLLYITSAGNEGQAEQAKNAMKFSVIGIIVALIGYVAIKAIDSLLRASSSF